MATITGTTVDVQLGEYKYRAIVDGNSIELYRGDVHLGRATWGGQSIQDAPHTLIEDAREALGHAIQANLSKSWRAATPAEGDDRENAVGPAYDLAPGEPNTPDAANRGQMGDQPDKPSRQGEKEVGTGGPGVDPNTGELGGQAIKPGRRAEGDGKKPPASSP